MTTELPPSFDLDRRRVGWWLVGAALVGVVGLFLVSFVGTFIFGLFVYYGARPVNRWIRERVDSREAAAMVTLLFIVVPTLALLGYAGFVAVREFTAAVGPGTLTLLLERLPGDQQSVAGALGNLPELVRRLDQLGQLSRVREGLTAVVGLLSTVATGLLHLTLALTFAFFLYRDGHQLRAWYRKEVGGRDTAAFSFLAGADADLEVVYFGNVLTILAVTIGSIVAYNGYNVVAPAAVTLPFPTLLAILTGLATLVPIVVGKIVYVPTVAYLVWRAVETGGGLVVFPAGFLIVVFLFLDLLPQSVVRPYISGQTMHEGAVLFAYILGAALFGWYGLFLGPFLLVLVVQFANIVLGDLIRGLPFSPAPTETTTLGTDPTDADVDAADRPAHDAAASPDADPEETGDGDTGCE